MDLIKSGIINLRLYGAVEITMNKTIKKYAISSLITFLTGFGLVLLSSIDSLTIDSVKNGALAGAIFMALRAGVKSVLEFFLNDNK